MVSGSTDARRLELRRSDSQELIWQARPLAAPFHEKERSTARGLRIGIAEVLISDDAPVRQRGLLPKPLGAQAVARGLGAPLVVDPAAVD